MTLTMIALNYCNQLVWSHHGSRPPASLTLGGRREGRKEGGEEGGRGGRREAIVVIL